MNATDTAVYVGFALIGYHYGGVLAAGVVLVTAAFVDSRMGVNRQ